jgi:hypothetical protein
MLPLIIGALGMIAYGVSEENRKPKAVKKMANGGGVYQDYEDIISRDLKYKKYMKNLDRKTNIVQGEPNVVYLPFNDVFRVYKTSKKRKSNKMAKGGGLSTKEQNRFDELSKKINAYLKGEGKVSSKEMVEHAKLKHKRNLDKYPLYKEQIDWEKSNNYGKGGVIEKPYIVWVSKDGDTRELYGTYKSMRGANLVMNKLWETGEYEEVGNKPLSSYEKEGIYAKGGKVQEKDLFEYYEEQPAKIKKLFSKPKYEPIFNDEEFDYKDLKDLLEETEKLGYTFEIGPDKMPYNLRKK